MTQQILLRLPWEPDPQPIKLGVVRYANGFAINLTADRRKPIWLYGPAKSLVPWLRELLDKLESEADYRPSPHPQSNDYEPQPEPVLPSPVINGERPPLTVDDLAGLKTEEAYTLMIEYFKRESRYGPGIADPGLVSDLEDDYRRLTGKAYKPPKADPALEADLALLAPHAADLLDEAGQPRRGAQTMTANILGLNQPGGNSNRRRIKRGLAALAQRRAQERRAA